MAKTKTELETTKETKLFTYRDPNGVEREMELHTEDQDPQHPDDMMARIGQLKDAVEHLEKIKFNVIRPFYENQKLIVEELHRLAGEGYAWKSKDGIVYRAGTKSGTYVHFDPLTIERTRYCGFGETKGTLSLTAARDLGFEVEGK